MSRVQKAASRTAEMNCLWRAASYYEKDQYYKSDDSVAPLLLPSHMKFLVRYKTVRAFFRKIFAPEGTYEYVIARTKYIDVIFNDAIRIGCEQVVIFGAGFDTRSIRLNNNDKIKIFELDSDVTQKAKLNQLEKRGIKIRENVFYVPVDFNRESAEEKLLQHGFELNKRSLFILEGLTMYLKEDAVAEIFNLIRRLPASGSLIVFDHLYASVIRGEKQYSGEEKMLKRVRDAGEPWLFGIEEGRTADYLNKFGFDLVEEYNAKKLQAKYFTEPSGKVLSKINEVHNIVLAQVP